MKEKVSVLIADDNQEFSHTLSTYINAQDDMQVVGMARDGEEAIEIMQDITPDVVLLDVIMPHLDGLGVLEKISTMQINKKPICIMLSAVGQDKITQKAIALGAEYYVVKPFDIELLMKRIREIKFFKPSQNTNNFIAKETTKQQYIDISREESKKEENLEALVTNIIHEVGVPAQTTVDLAATEANKIMSKADTIAIFGSNQTTAEGVITANETLNKLATDPAEGIIGVGFDAGTPQKAAINNGKLIGSVTQSPLMMGYKTIYTLVDVCNGKTVEDIPMDGYWYNADNMEDEDIAPNLYD